MLYLSSTNILHLTRGSLLSFDLTTLLKQHYEHLSSTLAQCSCCILGIEQTMRKLLQSKGFAIIHYPWRNATPSSDVYK